ncbi:MAG: SLC13 family permease, partial [Xanthomonadales bacterium]|nr:SLC13 family permease [Xanthomonadales bacterium]
MDRQSRLESARRLALPLGPLSAFALGYAGVALGWPLEQAVTAAVTLWCAVWWVTEAVPMAVTALLPLALFPLVGVIEPSRAAEAYGHPLILLLLGGFILSQAMERSGAHRRIALLMLHAFGQRHPRRVVFGFIAASALLSMWISNTATTLMLLPVAAAALGPSASRTLSNAVFLGVAYGASVGGIGTPIGTPPNLIFMQVYGATTGNTPGFVEWMSWALPLVALGLPVIGLWLT